MDVKGLQALQQNMKAVGDKVANKYMRRALKAGAEPIAVEARADIPAGPLSDAVKIQPIKRNRKGRIGYNVSLGKGWFTGSTFYGAFVEFGHKIGRRLTGSQKRIGMTDNRERAVGQHYMQTAFEKMAETSVSIVTETLAANFPAAVKEAGGK